MIHPTSWAQIRPSFSNEVFQPLINGLTKGLTGLTVFVFTPIISGDIYITLLITGRTFPPCRCVCFFLVEKERQAQFGPIYAHTALLNFRDEMYLIAGSRHEGGQDVTMDGVWMCKPQASFGSPNQF